MPIDDIEQCRIFMDNLRIKEHIPSALNDIKNLFISKPPNEAFITLQAVGLKDILRCLICADMNLVEQTCEVLKICFEKFDAGDVLIHYTTHIMWLLRHGKSCVRRLAIDEVFRAIVKDPALLPVPQYVDVFVVTGQMVTDDDVGVCNKAIQITSHLPAEAYPRVLDEMKIALDLNNSSKCNAYEVIINISIKSNELFKLATEMGYIDFMVSELESKDILYQMNILELLSRLAVTPNGFDYLFNHGALKKIAKIFADSQADPLCNLLTPGYMRFFGSIAHHYPREIENYAVLLNCMFEAIKNGDPAVMPIALDTLGFIGTNIEGKLCLAAIGSSYTQAVRKVGEWIQNSPEEIKIRSLYCLANLLGVEKDPSVKNTTKVDLRVTFMAREWFRSLSDNPASIEMLFRICQTPFPEIRLAGFSLLDAVCQHNWGQELVAGSAGFIEYLLDRTVDHTKQCKEAKYNIIKRLARSPSFNASITERLQTYVLQGPFFSETTLGVAMEEGAD